MAEQGKFYGKPVKAVWIGTEGKAIEYAPVVRCKDCKKVNAGGLSLYCSLTGMPMDEDDFCSYGERRTNE